MYHIVKVPVLLLHLSCSILGSNAGRQQAVSLLYKLCDVTCKRDLQHTQQVSRCCDGTSILVAHIHQAVINDGCDQCSCIHILKCLSRHACKCHASCRLCCSHLLPGRACCHSCIPRLSPSRCEIHFKCNVRKLSKLVRQARFHCFPTGRHHGKNGAPARHPPTAERRLSTRCTAADAAPWHAG